MDEKEIIDWAVSMKDFAKKLFEQDGALAPVFFLMTADKFGKSQVVVIDVTAGMNNEEGKDAVSVLIRKACKEMNVYAVLFISEAWIRDCKDKNDVYVPPSQCKDRKEVIMVMLESYKKNRQWLIEIVRNGEKGKPKCGVERVLDAEMSEGRFAKFLQPCN
jgi:hypothetical protein